MQFDFAAFASPMAFFDSKHYPHGFSRSGHYSIKEAEWLAKHGQLLNDLWKGSVKPANELQKQFVKVVTGKADPENPLEKLWIKYLDKTTRPVKRYSCSYGVAEGDFGGEDFSASDL